MCECLSLVGTPFKYSGRDRTGMDCFGVVLAHLAHLGKQATDPFTHDTYPSDAVVFSFDAFDMPVVLVDGPPQPQQGDIVAFDFRRCGVADHCGVVIPGGSILHAREKLGVIVQPWRQLRPYCVGVYRCRG